MSDPKQEFDHEEFDRWFHRALGNTEERGHDAMRAAVLRGIGGHSPQRFADARRTRVLLPAIAVAAAVLVVLWTVLLLDRRTAPPLHDVVELPIFELEDTTFEESPAAPDILSDLLTMEFSE